MKILFLAIAACLVLSFPSSAQEKKKANFSDQYCGPYCINYCANPRKDGQPHSAACHPKCLQMCRELGH